MDETRLRHPPGGGATVGGTFGDEVRRARLAAGMTRTELARRTGLAVRTVSRIEAGSKVAGESRRLLAGALRLDPLEGAARLEEASDAAVGRRLRDMRRLRDDLPLSLLASILGDVSEAKLSRVERGLCRPRGGWAELISDDYARALGFTRAKDLWERIGLDP